VEDCKYVARIICGESGEQVVSGVDFLKPISLFAHALSLAQEVAAEHRNWCWLQAVP